MKADIPLAERQRLQAEEGRELRGALVRRHVQVLDERDAIEAVQIAMDVRSPAFRALADRIRG
ncbi:MULTISPECIES: hypothetical protein [unclassified Sphingomonas]|uniref:hypothetical protein n=1 Tax=unclassified Sphingomonas TaxID=196159 RepID=UPI000700AB68|nr:MULTISPECIES: hypothetical protein [unclassified Sphingomonas]KQM27324.1 hypothetical protein ASE58_10320 [Sphingomonas sp. Leaf9]KQM43661.1 hypothetical protein ASE57_10325 [Sphingomonas sp. Leaf11]